MDRVDLRNLLLSKEMIRCVTEPMQYPENTFDAICEVLEAAIEIDGEITQRFNDAIIKLKKL